MASEQWTGPQPLLADSSRSQAGSAHTQSVPMVVGAMAAFVGVVVLCSWLFGLPGLNHVHPILGGMSSHAAFCFTLAGVALLLVRAERARSWRRWVADASASTIVIISVFTIAASYGWGLGIDLPVQGALGHTLAARMPVPSALAFLALGFALLLLDAEILGSRPAELLSFAAMLISLLALIAYLFSFVSVFDILHRRPLAFHTVLLLLALPCGILMARPRHGLMSFATDPGVVGVMVRRLLPAAIGIPILVGWLITEGVRGGLYPSILNLSYYAVSIIVVFSGLIWLTAGSLRRIDSRRHEAETQVRQLNAELEAALIGEQHARRETEEASRLKDEFLMTVSHELRTPLTTICGWVYMLSKNIIPSEQRAGAVAAIERNARAQTQLIDDLLEVSLAVTGKVRLNAQTFDLSDVVLSTTETLRPALDAKSLHLRTSINKDAGQILADPDRVQQIVWNLLSNAIKFTPNGGAVEIRVARVDGQAEIVVSDTGVGIHREVIPFVFDRFRQAEAGSRRRFGGLGLGLAIVRHLAELHGGTVRAESAGEGKGATFRVRLPVKAAYGSESSTPQAPYRNFSQMAEEEVPDLVRGSSETASRAR